MKQLLNKILPRDRHFYVTNPERSEEFHYNKKSGIGNPYSRSGFKQQNSDCEESSPDEIRKTITERSGAIFIRTFILSGILFFIQLLVCLYTGAAWTTYAALVIMLPAAAYILFNVLDFSYYGVYLHYRVDGEKFKFYDKMSGSLYELSGAAGLWQVDRISPNEKPNSRGGAKEVYDRHPVRIKKSLPRFIKTGINVWCLDLKHVQYYFFPDCIIYCHRKTYSVTGYGSLSISYTEKPYHETGEDPVDAEKTGTAWLHPRKDGSQDRRFRNNRRISVLLYAEIVFSSSAGELFHLQVSDYKTAYLFYRFISGHLLHHSEARYKKPEQTKKKQRGREKPNEGGRSSSSSDSVLNRKDEIERAHAVLGLAAGASADEIRDAYYRMAKMYHPDLARGKKTFRIYEEKMKEINRAYEKLKG